LATKAQIIGKRTAKAMETNTGLITVVALKLSEDWPRLEMMPLITRPTISSY
jgi:hypothetical protein